MTIAKAPAYRVASLLLAASAVVLAACASQPVPPPIPVTMNRSVGLSSRDLQDTTYASLYDLILARRPFWLVSRTAERGAQPNEVRVIFDNQILNSVNDLRAIAPASIHSVGYTDPAARNRGPVDGLRFEAGTIMVRSKNLVGRTER